MTMFKALLLATVAGVGAANIPSPNLVDRNYPNSYGCAANKKCSSPKQQTSVSAYCSSYLKVPKTATKTISKCTTSTVYSTVYSATITKPAPTVTSTLTGCQRPATTPPSGEGSTGGDAPAGKRDAEAELDKRYGNAVPKPSCLSYNEPQHISSACSCLSIEPKSTKRVTVTSTKTKTKTITTASTVDDTPVTTTVYKAPAEATPTFAILRDDLSYFRQGCGQLKLSNEPTCGTPVFDSFQNDAASYAILFQLNNGANGLTGTPTILSGRNAMAVTTQDGKPLGVPHQRSRDTDPEDFIVNVDTTAPISPSLRALTCSLTFDPEDGTCPLDCQGFSADDTNQGAMFASGSWYLGPPGTVSEDTFKTFAVSEQNLADDEEGDAEEGGNAAQPGPDVERGQSGGGN